MATHTLNLALKPATLIQRYKRFLADVTLATGETITIHCPNTGSMKNCGAAGDTIWYSTSDNAKRKYPNSWELTQTATGQLICVNTQRANELIAKELEAGNLAELAHYPEFKREVKYGNNSRIDLLLQGPELPNLYIEIKSCTLLEEDGIGYFPDAVTQRGQKHLNELMAMVAQGHRAMLLFAVLHTGIEKVRPANHIDPAYSQLLAQAAAAGVEICAYRATISAEGISLQQAVPVEI